MFKRTIKSLLYYIFNIFIMNVPFHFIRDFFIKIILSNYGKGSTLLMNVEIRKGQNISIGDNSIVNARVLLDGRGGKLTIGNNVDIAQDTTIWTLSHDPHSDTHQDIGKDVTIEDYVWIGANVTILPGVTVKKGAVIGTCSVVTKDIIENEIVAGNPAKKISIRKSKLNYTLNYKPIFK
jgi:acetyltransferase-like isoleucine patch superfamily enzyme